MRRRKQECREATAQPDHELGFSLLEMLVVLAIMALVAALVAPRLFNQVDKSKLTVANTQINSIATALDTMRLDIGRYPTESEGLALLVEAPSNEISGWFGPYLEGDVPADPWGRDYIYRLAEGDQAGFATRPYVYSLGADGEEGGSGLDQDLGRQPAGN
jgi:general secretion pathway protein G